MEDFYSDSGATFARIFNNFDLPAFAKEASEESTEKLAGFPDSAFADPISRTLPIHDRAHTYISAAYVYSQPWDKQAQELKDIVEKRAEFFKISNELPMLQAHITSLLQEPEVKEAGAGDAVFQIQVNTPYVRALIGSGKEAAAKMENRFLQLLTQIDFEKRSELATEVIDALVGNGLSPSDDTLKIAARGEHDPDLYAQQVLLRQGLIPDSLRKDAALEPIKIAATDLDARLKALQALDFEHKLASFYGERLLDPHRAVYSRVPKEAKLIVVGPKSYPLSRWEGETNDFQEGLQAALGEKAANLINADGSPNFDKFAELSEDEAKVLNRYLG